VNHAGILTNRGDRSTREKKENTMNRQLTRRTFLRQAAAGGTGLWILSHSRSVFSYAANEKLNVAIIGCGGRGKWFTEKIPTLANMVAMCDVNQSKAQAAYKEHPDVPKFLDFREMLDKMDREIDAVTVATPDHAHAQASVTAMRRGKHVLCEKGLTRTIHEAQLMRKVAVEKKLATQMGNPGSSCSGARRGMELIQDGTIGDVREVYGWGAFPGPNYRKLPIGEQKVPAYLNWDLWLGYAPMRPFHAQWLNWDAWREFGAGVIGMWASHASYIAWNGLNMLALWEPGPGEKVRIRVEAQVPEINKLSYPAWAVVHFKVPARGTQPPLDWYWISGALNAPGWIEKIEAAVNKKIGWREQKWNEPVPHAGSVLLGSKGNLHAVGANGGFEFTHPEKFKGVNMGNPQRYSVVREGYFGHEADWLRAARDGKYTVSDFRNAGPYTEFLLLANVATQTEGAIEYDPIEGKITNNEQANALLTCERRKGWEL
jgi:hypothetical protein